MKKYVQFSVFGFALCMLQGHASTTTIDECFMHFQNKDFEQALEPCRSAAIDGSPQAKYHLGMMYSNGWGLEKNAQIGFKLIEDAAYLDYPDAVSQMGTIFWSGANGEKNEVRACDWWEKAANQGHATGFEKAGVCYMLGKGRDKDIARAYRLLTEAADRGSASAIYIVNRYKEVFPSEAHALSDSTR